jgi:hypothetical protein
MSQITLRHIDKRIESLIRKKARDQNKSLSEVANQMLAKAIGLDEGEGKKRNLRSLAGKWTEVESAAFEATQAPFNEIDEELWK